MEGTLQWFIFSGFRDPFQNTEADFQHLQEKQVRHEKRSHGSLFNRDDILYLP